MNPYVAPLEEMHFAIRELSDFDRVANLANAEILADPELTNSILEQAARFAQEVLAPVDSIGDKEGARWSAEGVTTPKGFSDAWQRFVEAGWNGIAIPEALGGMGLPNLLCAAVEEMFTSANKAFCFCPDLTAFAIKALTVGADEVLKERYLPNLVSGRWTATMNLTEPQAGSDVGALRTRAVPQVDGSYRLFGQKIFITYGDHDLAENIVHLVLARTPDAPEGTRGVSLFVVPKFIPNEDGSLGARNDVTCAGIEHKLGNHGSPTCTMIYGDRGEGAVGWRVGAENKGLQTMFVMVNAARFAVGQEGTAMSEKAYQQAVLYARERVQGKPADGGTASVAIIQHPDVRRMLLMMRCRTEAMRALAYAIAGARDLAANHPHVEVRRDRQAFVDLMIPIFKGWSTENALDITSTSIQVHGGYGYVEESGASQPFRDVRVAAIYEGTTSIQAHDLVERKLCRDGGAAMEVWLSQVEETSRALAQSDSAELQHIAVALDAALASLRAAVGWTLEHFAERPMEVLAGSVPLLKLCGIAAGGWQMSRAALAASGHLQQGQYDHAFLQRKIVSARFYAAHLLPEVAALGQAVVSVGESTMALGDAAF